MTARALAIWIPALALGLANAGWAEPPDWQLWSGLFFKSARPHERWDFSGEYQVRLNNDVRDLKSHFFETFAYYKATSRLELNAGYRYTIRPDRTENRLSGGFFVRHALGLKGSGSDDPRARVTHQILYQRDYDAEFNDVLISSNSVRYVFLVLKPVSKTVAPFAVAAGQYTWNAEYTGLEKLRFAAGLRIDRGKKDRIKIHYVFEKRNFDAAPAQFASIIWLRYEVIF